MTPRPLYARNQPAAPERDIHRIIRWSIVGVAALVILLTLIFGGAVARIVALVVALATLQGLWRGATELAGLVIGLILAAFLAGPVGRLLESPIASIAGTTGLTNRLVSMGLVAIVVVAASGITSRILARRLLAKRPAWKVWDPYLGAGLGLVEGSLLSLMLIWTPLLLEPVARADVDQARAAIDQGMDPAVAGVNPVSESIVRYAQEVRDSALGGIAESTNPLKSSRFLSIAADFAAISRDSDAMDHLVNSDVMKELQALPSVEEARRILEDDPDMRHILDHGVTTEGLRALLDSPTILRIFDETSIIDDCTPLADRLIAAIEAARTKVRPTRPPP